MFNNGNGINHDSSGVTIGKNNISFANSGSDYQGMDAASDNNLGQDSAFAGDANYVQTSQSALQMFVGPSGSPRDLHILSTSDAHDAGADLSGDREPISPEIQFCPSPTISIWTRAPEAGTSERMMTPLGQPRFPPATPYRSHSITLSW